MIIGIHLLISDNQNCEGNDFVSNYLVSMWHSDCFSEAYDFSFSLKLMLTSTAFCCFEHSIRLMVHKNSLLLALYILVTRIPCILVMAFLVRSGGIISTASMNFCSKVASKATLSRVT